MIKTIKRHLISLKPFKIDLILLTLITTLLGIIGGLPLNIQDSILVPALNAARRLGNPVYFSSPGFVIYIFMITYIFLFIFLYLIGMIRDTSEFRTLFETNTLFHNISFEFPGHLIILLFSVLGIICTYLIAYKIIKKRSISFLSALFVATSLSWVTNSHLLTVNIPFAALVALTILLVLNFIKENEPMSLKQIIILGIVLGITSSTKFNGFLVSVAILAPMLFSYRKKYRQLLKHILIIGVTAVLVFVILNPYIFLDFKTFNAYNSIQRNTVKIGWYGAESETNYSWIDHITKSLYLGYGLFPLILSVLGTIYLVLNRRTSLPIKITVITFPLFFYFVIGLSKSVLYRYMLPLFPILGAYSGLGVYGLYVSLMRLINKIASPDFRKLKFILIIFLVLISFVSLYPNIRDSIKHDLLLREIDTRTDLLNVFNEAGLNNITLNIYYGTYLSDVLYNNSNIAIGKNLWAKSINTNVLESEADIFAFDSFSHDRVIYSHRSGNQNMTYENYYGLPNDIKKDYKNFEGLYVIQISPFIAPKEQVPFSQQSGTAPFPPDIIFRNKPGPFIEIYFKSMIIAKKVEDSCRKQKINCISLSGKKSYYFRNIQI